MWSGLSVILSINAKIGLFAKLLQCVDLDSVIQFYDVHISERQADANFLVLLLEGQFALLRRFDARDRLVHGDRNFDFFYLGMPGFLSIVEQRNGDAFIAI